MAVNQRRLAQIMLRHCNEVEERCPGYRQALLEHLIQVLDLEDLNRRGGGIKILEKVTDQCEALGGFLTSKRGGDES
jgi:hypothetical protein